MIIQGRLLENVKLFDSLWFHFDLDGIECNQIHLGCVFSREFSMRLYWLNHHSNNMLILKLITFICQLG